VNNLKIGDRVIARLNTISGMQEVPATVEDFSTWHNEVYVRLHKIDSLFGYRTHINVNRVKRVIDGTALP
jgi:hypothetical protein